MAPDEFAKKLVHTMARVIPQYGMVPQAIAFNMFLVCFPSLIFVAAWDPESLRKCEQF
jgi:membrane protein